MKLTHFKKSIFLPLCILGIIFGSNFVLAQMDKPTIMQDDINADLVFLNQKKQSDCVAKGGVWDGAKCNAPQLSPTSCIDSKEISCKLNEKCSWNVAAKICEDKKDNSFYNALNTIYTTGTGFVSGLLSKSGMDEYKVIVDIPCDNTITKIIGGADCNATKKYKESVPLYVARLYQFGFGIVGVIALLMVIYGAAQYTLSAGGLQTEDAKEIIQNALYGLLLLFAAYLILYTINPGLVSIKTPTLTPINVDKFLISNQINTAPITTGNTPTETTGTTIANCKIATQPPTVICTECNTGYEFIAASKKCEPCKSGWTYSTSKKMCLDCTDVTKDISNLVTTGAIKTTQDLNGYFPNYSTSSCLVTNNNSTTNPNNQLIPGINVLPRQ